jgi:ceramide glucosyltransferase
LRRETLAEIGGFRTVANELADDYALGQAIRAQGYRIAVPPFAVAHLCTTKDAGGLWRQEQRGARTVRSIDPTGYAGSIVTHPLPWALIAMAAAALSGADTLLPEIGLVIASMLGRVALLRQTEHAFRLPPQAYWLVPVRDLLSFAVFLSSFMGRDVSWRGRSYHAAPVGGWVGGVRSP